MSPPPFFSLRPSESILGGHIAQHGAAEQHGDGALQRHHHPPGGGAHQPQGQHPAADPGVRGAAQHEDEAGGRDRHLQDADGRRRLQVRVRTAPGDDGDGVGGEYKIHAWLSYDDEER